MRRRGEILTKKCDMCQQIIVVGAFLETIELCQEAGFEVVGLVDNNLKGFFYGIPIIGTDDDVKCLHNEYASCGIVISPDSPKVKETLSALYKKVGFSLPKIISPKAHVSKSATINEGAIIQAGVNVSSNAYIGRMVKLNFNVNVMHDVRVEDYCVIAPNVVLLGRSSVFKSSYVGANTIILPDAFVPSYSDVKPCTIIKYERNNE